MIYKVNLSKAAIYAMYTLTLRSFQFVGRHLHVSCSSKYERHLTAFSYVKISSYAEWYQNFALLFTDRYFKLGVTKQDKDKRSVCVLPRSYKHTILMLQATWFIQLERVTHHSTKSPSGAILPPCAAGAQTWVT